MASTIVTKNSSTASAVPLTGDLTQGELAVNVTDKRLFTKNSGGTVVELGTNPASLALPNGTANGVLYLNGSKVATSGSALTFDGTTFGVTGATTVTGDISTTSTGRLNVRGSGTGVNYDLQIDNSDTLVNFRASRSNAVTKAYAWYLDNSVTEAMRLTSTGLGIGTSSPNYRLTVQESGNSYIVLQSATAGYANLRFIVTSAAGIVGTEGAFPLVFRTSDAERMRLDSSGNLGLGVTPNAWNGNRLALQIGGSSGGYVTANNGLAIGSNYYYSSGDKFVANGYAPLYYMSSGNGQHQWYTSNNNSSGAGAAVSLTQAMTLDASGTLLINSTSNSGGCKLMSNVGSNGWPVTSGTTQTYGALRLRGGNNAVLDFGLNSTDTWIQATDLSNLASTYTIYLNPNGGEVITSGKTDNGAYNLQCNGTGVWGAGAYVNGSDARIKEDVAPIDSGLDVIAKLNPVTYRYKESWSKDQSIQTGFIAQELLVALEGKNYVDGVVQQGGAEGYYSVAYQNMIPLLAKAIQEQQALIQTLTDRITALEGK